MENVLQYQSNRTKRIAHAEDMRAVEPSTAGRVRLTVVNPVLNIFITLINSNLTIVNLVL
jgi:hypothetical protein